MSSNHVLLHFARNPEYGESEPSDRLFEVRQVVEHFNSKMLAIY